MQHETLLTGGKLQHGQPICKTYMRLLDNLELILQAYQRMYVPRSMFVCLMYDNGEVIELG